MKEKYSKRIVIVIVGILLVLFVSNKIMKPKSNVLPEVKLKEIVNKDKSFAIMIQSKNGYKEYDSDTWPGSSYKFKEAKCIDNNGDEVKETITYEEGKITLTTNKTVYCTVYFDKSIIGKLREDEELANKDNLSTDLQGGMYRYQGTDDVHNWICFGTTNNCGTNEDNIDKYMYRIIGITEEGQLYLIKETFLKYGNTTGFAWNSNGTLPGCLGDACEWPNVDLYKRLNGETSNGSPIFVDSSEYDYLKSKDSNSYGEASEWYKLIADHNWMYGDTKENSGSTNTYNGDYMYAIETGKVATKRYWPDEEQGQTTCSDDSPCTEKDYTWSAEKSVNAKIGLMYMHDYMYAYANCSSGECIESGNPENSKNVQNSWVHFQKDEYNSSPSYEWLITRYGVENDTSVIMFARRMDYTGYVFNNNFVNGYGVRPVFYLNSSAKIASGKGTKESPFILEI